MLAVTSVAPSKRLLGSLNGIAQMGSSLSKQAYPSTRRDPLIRARALALAVG